MEFKRNARTVDGDGPFQSGERLQFVTLDVELDEIDVANTHRLDNLVPHMNLQVLGRV